MTTTKNEIIIWICEIQHQFDLKQKHLKLHSQIWSKKKTKSFSIMLNEYMYMHKKSIYNPNEEIRKRKIQIKFHIM